MELNDTLNDTPSSSRIHIGIFGRRNAGKSSLINALTGQDLAIVSEHKGTTTDPVQKAMEFLPLGPVVLIDTPGLDDEGELGALRIEKAVRVLAKCDLALLVIDIRDPFDEHDQDILTRIEAKKIPYILVLNKSDLAEKPPEVLNLPVSAPAIVVSSKTGAQIHALKELIAKLARQDKPQKRIVADLVDPGDFVVLVVPIDSGAPKGRLILPQQQTIRDILDARAVPVVCQVSELSATLANLREKPRLVITDSQAFAAVDAATPPDILLTSFSILFARYKGDLAEMVRGAAILDRLADGDRVLIAEGCTHHRQCDDIGTVKLPRWLRAHTGRALEFDFSSGTGFPQDLSPYTLILHCGGCMLNDREMQYRIQCAKGAGRPITNYGTAIAHMHGILRRSLLPFPDIAALLNQAPASSSPDGTIL